MDRSQFEPANLLALALELQQPAILLGILTSAVAWANRIPRIPQALRARIAWISSPGVLIAAPIYLWGYSAAVDAISFFDMLGRVAISSPQAYATHILTNIWANSLSQFIALFAVFFPGFVTALAGHSAIKSKDVAGAPWAIAAVATDYLLVLLLATPVGGPS